VGLAPVQGRKLVGWGSGSRLHSVFGMTTSQISAGAPVRSTGTAARMFRQLGRDSQYVLVGFPLGIVTIAVLMTVFSVGAGTLVTVAGLPILAGALVLARGFATVERARVAAVDGHGLPHHAYKKALPTDGFFRRAFRPISDGQTWLDLIHGIFRFIPSTIAFSFVVTWWAGAIGGLTTPLWDWSIPRGGDNTDLPELIGLGSGTDVRIAFYLAAGAFFALTLVPVVRMAAKLEAGFARALLSGVSELRDRAARVDG
jgi:hypothetical protein